VFSELYSLNLCTSEFFTFEFQKMAQHRDVLEGVFSTAEQCSKTRWQCRENVPAMCLTESCVMGIDEAGRGGEMIIVLKVPNLILELPFSFLCSPHV
jgi:hypothetical protein